MVTTGGRTCSIHQLTFQIQSASHKLGAPGLSREKAELCLVTVVTAGKVRCVAGAQDNVVSAQLYSGNRIEGSAAHCTGDPRKFRIHEIGIIFIHVKRVHFALNCLVQLHCLGSRWGRRLAAVGAAGWQQLVKLAALDKNHFILNRQCMVLAFLFFTIALFRTLYLLILGYTMTQPAIKLLEFDKKHLKCIEIMLCKCNERT